MRYQSAGRRTGHAKTGMKVFGLAGWSGSGKTTLAIKLIPALVARGVTVSTIKHAHHSFDIDHPARTPTSTARPAPPEVMVTSGERWALMRELRGAAEPDIADLVARMSPVDLVLIEGFKREPHDKIEVHSAPPAVACRCCRKDPRIVAIACDEPVRGPRRGGLPRLDLNDEGPSPDSSSPTAGWRRPPPKPPRSG